MPILNLLAVWILPALGGPDTQDLPTLLGAPAPVVSTWGSTSLAAPEAGASLRFQANEPFAVDVGLHGRLSFPVGQLQDADNIIITGGGGATIIFDDHLRYRDLFDIGYGLALEAALLFIEPEQRRGGGMHSSAPTFGIYASIQADEFGGDSVSDAAGAKLRADDMRIYSALAGIKFAQSIDARWFGDARIGLGIARYEEVEGKLTGAGGLASATGILFEATETWVFELRAHGGTRFGALAFVVGGGFRAIGQPDEGHGASSLDLSPETLYTFDIDVGVELGF